MKYKNIINLPHHISKKHKPMSIEQRSSIFAPFNALNGYDQAIKEIARITKQKIELNNEEKLLLNQKLIQIKKNIKEKPLIKITYFIKDKYKSGGEYLTKTNIVTKIDIYNHYLYLNKTKIHFENILKITIQ